MKPDTSPVKNVSDTAFWVATYRALESKKENPLFRDPLAEELAGEYGKRVSGSMKPIARYAYWSVTIRTCLIDDYLLKYIDQGYKTIINLGAGLDTRPYRLTMPADTQWIEIDFPEVIDFKNKKLQKHKPNCSLERIGFNLSNEAERVNCFNELNNKIGPAIILTEGVIPYLSEDAVGSLAKDIKDQSNFKLWLAEYYSPKVYPRYQSPKFKSLMGDTPFQFFPVDWLAFFESYGWTQKEVKYLHDEAQKHQRNFPLPLFAKILRVIIGEKRMMKSIRTFSAYILFEKN
jgi:methyltransferase (TIGR00027 family)